MEMSNKVVLLLIVCLSSHLVAGTPSIAEQPASSPASAPSPSFSTQTTDGPTLLQTAEDPAILKTCEATGYPWLCLSSIAPFYSKGEFHPETLIESEISAAQVHAQLLLEESQKIAKDPSTPSDIAESLNYCRENFEGAIEDLNEATNGIAIRDIGLMNSMLSAVISDICTCEDTFSEMTTGPSPLADKQETLKNMASNCLAILDYFHW